MQTVLLSGGSGFVGGQILRALEKRDVEIILVCRPTSPISKKSSKKIKHIVYADNMFLESAEWFYNICQNVDIVIHAAWYVEPGKYLDSELNRECQSGTIQFAISALDAGASKFIGLGTCFEYDVAYGTLSIDTPLKPESKYAIAKAETFQAILQHYKNHQQQNRFAWCRLFYLYGENEDERRLVAQIRKKLSMGEEVKLSQGHQIRDFLDVSVAAKQILDIAFSDASGPQNICSGEGISVREMAKLIAADYKNAENLLLFGALPERNFDPARIVGIKSTI